MRGETRDQFEAFDWRIVDRGPRPGVSLPQSRDIRKVRLPARYAETKGSGLFRHMHDGHKQTERWADPLVWRAEPSQSLKGAAEVEQKYTLLKW